jgi:hypothetical protein
MSKLMQKLLVGAGVAGTVGMASAVVDYSGISGAVDVSVVAAAIVAMGVLKVGPNVARWATNKLANFFR